MILKSLAKNVNLLNITLTALGVTLAYHTAFSLRHMDAKFVSPAPPKQVVGASKAEPPQIQIPSPNDYTIIGEQNLFHPERKIPVDKPAAVPLPVPEFILFGTLITDDVRIAYMEDKKAPVSSPGRGKRQVPLKKGESLSGFSLLQIDSDRVLMARGDEKISVPLSGPKVREAAAVAAAQPPAPAGATPFPAPQAPASASAGAASRPRAVQSAAPVQQPAAPATPPGTRPLLRQRRPASSYVNTPSE